MTFGTTTKWLAVSLYYGEPWDEFLIKALKPYTDVVLQTGVADRFFFLRNWENGPNIRLWFKGNPFILASMLRPNLDEHFQQYFESRPSSSSQPSYPDGLKGAYQWHPNNSIHYSPDDPASSLFGGVFELELVERQYEASSVLVLDTIKQKAHRWTYNEMISCAIKIHLGFAYSLGMDVEETTAFFGYLSNQWFQTQYAKQHEERLKTTQSFAKIFALQRKDTVPYHAALWELMKNYQRMDDPIFQEWINVNADTGMELNFALDNQRLRPKRPPHSFSETYPLAWDYYLPLVKLTNNRLGILNKNEGFLFYTMAHSMRSADVKDWESVNDLVSYSKSW